MCHSPVLTSRPFSHFFPPSVIFSTDIPIVRANRAAITKIVSHLAHKCLFPRKRKLPLWKHFSLPNEKASSYSQKSLLRFGPCAGHRWSARENGLNFFKIRESPEREWSERCYVLGLERAVIKCGSLFLSLLSPNLILTTAFQLQPVSGSQHNVDTARDEDAHGQSPWMAVRALLPTKAIAKKGTFFSQFFPLTDLNRISWDMENLTPLPSRSFSPAKSQRSVCKPAGKKFTRIFSMVT